MVGLKVENLQLCEEALEKRALAEHLAVAAQIQKDLLPAQCPKIPGLDIAAFQVPCFQVGGDYYDFFRLAGERLACVVADVSGKGPGAALLMATLRAFLIAQIRQGRNPKDLTRDLNNFIHESSDPERYISFFYAELESDGKVQFVNAGHHPPMIVGGSKTQELGAHGLPLGFVPDVDYGESAAKMESGDILVLFTDGITDRENKGGTEFGQQRLQDVVKDAKGLSAKEILESSLTSVFHFGEDQPRQDDETLVIIKKI
jgi:sigma-B regulation protein RsbU (phosphoserine phosphatase)